MSDGIIKLDIGECFFGFFILLLGVIANFLRAFLLVIV